MPLPGIMQAPLPANTLNQRARQHHLPSPLGCSPSAPIPGQKSSCTLLVKGLPRGGSGDGLPVGCCKRPLPAQARVSCRHPNSAAGGPEAPLPSTRGRAPPPGALGPACGVAIPPGESLCSRYHVGGGCGCQPRAQCLSPAPGRCLWGELQRTPTGTTLGQ